MNKKTKRNIFKIAFLLVIIILVVLLVSLLDPKNIAEKRLKSINDESFVSGKSIFPKNLYYALENYTGGIDATTVAKDFENYTQIVIPMYHKKFKNMTTEEIEKYYNKNTKLIFKESGIQNIDEFKNIVFEIAKLDGRKLEYTYSEIIEGTINYNNNQSTGCIKIVYNDSEELYLNFKVLNDNFSYEHPVKLMTGVNIQEVKKQEEINSKKTNVEVNQTGKVMK